MKERILHLYTKSFPYGKGEPFLENELPFLAKEFSRVVIFPMEKEGGIRELPDNVYIVYFSLDSFSSSNIFKNNLFYFVKIFLLEMLNEKNRRPYRKYFSKYRSYLLQQFFRAEKLAHHLKQVNYVDNITHYSFWTEEWAIVLGILKQRKQISNKCISRVHGFDLFKERRDDNIIPFRYFQLKSMDRIVAVSQAGLNYLNKHYPLYSDKFVLHRLGVHDNGDNPYDSNVVFTLVSCANLIPLKRVQLIPDVLRKLDFPVHWIHFGDGELMESIMEVVKSLPHHIHVELKGKVSNKEILDFYGENTVHAVILLSETEGGCPVALQEAASFGIPLIGTKAGGIPEIIEDGKNGILLPLNFEISQVVCSLNEIKHKQVHFRGKSKEVWKNKLDAKLNYEVFVKSILC